MALGVAYREGPRNPTKLSVFGARECPPITYNLKSRLLNGPLLCGTFIFSLDPATIEIAARAGFDFVIVDREHMPLS